MKTNKREKIREIAVERQMRLNGRQVSEMPYAIDKFFGLSDNSGNSATEKTSIISTQKKRTAYD